VLAIASALAAARYSGVPGKYVELAVGKVREIIGGVLTSSLISRFIRKAICTCVWFKLPTTSRALLASKFLKIAKSRVLREILVGIMVEIELSTLRGRAIYYGVLVALRSGLREALGDFKKLITLGIGYLNLPLMWRVLG
jgi:hypothetical protein